MNVKRLILDVLTVFSLSLVASIGVTFLWNLIVHRTGTVDWETSFRFAILFAIIVPWMEARRGRPA
ncbi:MAG TPA: hypothetical protein VFK69_02605 [Candidatus Eisenbacteria bacterium]|nr:hypothetical protein [Candidatus Eisenbacteria bacterium]